MAPLLQQHLSEIRSLCRKYEVEQLEAFGSLARGDFDPDRSDIDFLVLFKPNSSRNADDQYFGLMEELQKLLSRTVDLVDIRAARNPYFIADALKNRVELYAA